jgi:hypothetical protein
VKLDTPTRIPVTGVTIVTIGGVVITNGVFTSGAATAVSLFAAGTASAILDFTITAGTPTLTPGQYGYATFSTTIGYLTGAQL